MRSTQRLVLSLLLLPGCESQHSDTAVVLVDEPLPEDCTQDPALLASLGWEPTRVATVLELSWELLDAAPSRVVFGVSDEERWLATPLVGAGEPGRALLLGLPEGAEVVLWVEAERDGQRVCSPPTGALTGWLPAALPVPTVTIGGGSGADPRYLVTPVFRRGSLEWATILDEQGRYVWASQLGFSGTRLRLARDGDGLLLLRLAYPDSQGVAGVVRLGLDGVERETVPFPDPWVDFLELEDGTLAVLVDDIREVEHEGLLRTVRGDALMLRAPDGDTRILWSSFDATAPTFLHPYPTIITASGASAEDWSHVNGLGYDEQERVFYLSAGGLDAIFAVDGLTGETLWELSDHGGDWLVDEPRPLVQVPHSVQPVAPERLLVLNHYGGEDACTDGTEVLLDPETGRASRVATWQIEECMHATYLGNAERLPDGSTLIAWSDLGQIDILSTVGDPTLRLALPLGGMFGFVQPVTSLYPEQAP